MRFFCDEMRRILSVPDGYLLRYHVRGILTSVRITHMNTPAFVSKTGSADGRVLLCADPVTGYLRADTRRVGPASYISSTTTLRGMLSPAYIIILTLVQTAQSGHCHTQHFSPRRRPSSRKASSMMVLLRRNVVRTTRRHVDSNASEEYAVSIFTA